MCDEHVDHWETKELVSRKWHWCVECKGLIAPGDTYARTVIINDGSAHTEKRHVACDDLAWEVAHWGDGCRYDTMHEELDNIGPSQETRAVQAVLVWMRSRTRQRYAKALAEAWGMTPERRR